MDLCRHRPGLCRPLWGGARCGPATACTSIAPLFPTAPSHTFLHTDSSCHANRACRHTNRTCTPSILRCRSSLLPVLRQLCAYKHCPFLKADGSQFCRGLSRLRRRRRQRRRCCHGRSCKCVSREYVGVAIVVDAMVVHSSGCHGMYESERPRLGSRCCHRHLPSPPPGCRFGRHAIPPHSALPIPPTH